MSLREGTDGGAADRRARRAVAVVFAVHGTASGTFATRIPWLREHLALTPGRLGVALVCVTLGAAAAMPLAAWLEHRLGARAALRYTSLACCAGLLLPPLMPGLLWLCAGLFVFGCGLGVMDVAMNAQGVHVEERYGRSVMSSLHGMWSVGGLVGGAGGALAAHAGLPATVHLALVAPVLGTVAGVACRWVLDVRAPAGDGAPAPPRFALPTRGALAVGLVGFCAVFAEGASMDWSGIYLRDVTGASPGLAASAYTAFACTMALARLAGDVTVQRFGAVRTVRAGGVLATLGGALVVAAESPPAAVGGYALIGVGIAVVVPLCFSAAGRTSAGAPGQAIAGVATLAYASGLAAPAAVGWIAEATSLTSSFALVTVLTAGLVVGAPMLRPAPRGPVPATPDGLPEETAAGPAAAAGRQAEGPGRRGAPGAGR